MQPDAGAPADAGPLDADSPASVDGPRDVSPLDVRPPDGPPPPPPDAPPPPPPDAPPPPPPPPPRDTGAGLEALPPGADLGRGLVAYLRLDDGAGSAAARDSSGNGNTGSLVQLDPLAAWVGGHLGTALDIAGRGWVAIPESVTVDSVTDGFTISAWVSRTGDGTIASRRAVGANGFLYRFFITGGQLGLQINSSNGAHADFVGTAASVPTGRFVHVAAVYDKVTARVFLSGTAVGEQGYALAIGPENSPLLIGAREDATLVNADDRLAGQIDEVAIYNRALSGAEVQGLADGFLPPAR
jgi:hypothetical protein